MENLKDLFDEEALARLDARIMEICEHEEKDELEEEDISRLVEILVDLTPWWWKRSLEKAGEDLIDPKLKKELLKEGVEWIPVLEHNGFVWDHQDIEAFRMELIDIIRDEIANLMDETPQTKYEILYGVFRSEEVFRIHENGRYDIFDWRTLRIEKILTINRFFLTLETKTGLEVLEELC